MIVDAGGTLATGVLAASAARECRAQRIPTLVHGKCD